MIITEVQTEALHSVAPGSSGPVRAKIHEDYMLELYPSHMSLLHVPNCVLGDSSREIPTTASRSPRIMRFKCQGHGLILKQSLALAGGEGTKASTMFSRRRGPCSCFEICKDSASG